MDENTDIGETFSLLLRWSWLILGAAALVGVAAFTLTKATEDDTVVAESRLAVTESVGWPFYFAKRDTYIGLATDSELVDAALASAGGGVDSIEVFGDPDDIRLTVRAEGSERAAVRQAVNDVADQLVTASRDTIAPGLIAQEEELERELARVSDDVAATEQVFLEATGREAELREALRQSPPDPVQLEISADTAQSDASRASGRLVALDRSRLALEESLAEVRSEMAKETPELETIDRASFDVVAGSRAREVGAAAAGLTAVLLISVVPALGRGFGRLRSAGRLQALSGTPVQDLTALTPTEITLTRAVRRSLEQRAPKQLALVLSDKLSSSTASTIAVKRAMSAIAPVTVLSTTEGAAEALFDAEGVVVMATPKDSLQRLRRLLGRATSVGVSADAAVLIDADGLSGLAGDRPQESG